MYDMSRRLKKIEKALKVGQEEQRVLNMIMFHNGELPPDHTVCNTTIHYVRYEEVIKERERQ